MKKLTCISFIAFTLLALMLAGCNTSPVFENHLIGTWKYIDYQTDDWEKIIFKENKKYELHNHDAYLGQTIKYSGNYTFTDTTFSLRQYSTSTNFTFMYAIVDEVLYVRNGKTYIKQ